MTQIFLTPEQVQLFHQSTDPVSVYDPQGKMVGVLQRVHQICDEQGKVVEIIQSEYSAEFIAELKRRGKMPGRRFTSEQVTRHMKALAEVWERDGPFDKKRMMEILEQLRAEDSK